MTTKLCAKCGQYFEEDQIRTYNLTIKKSRNPHSVLSRLDSVNLCVGCDGRRKTTLERYLNQ